MKAIHEATHPAKVRKRAAAKGSESSADELLEMLGAEAAEEAADE